MTNINPVSTIRVARGSSPTHFQPIYNSNLTNSNSNSTSNHTNNFNNNSFKAILPDRIKINNILDGIVSTLYYIPSNYLRASHPLNNRQNYKDNNYSSRSNIYLSPLYRTHNYHTVDTILSALRKRTIYDSWTLKDIGLFETGIVKLGKDFYNIKKHFLPHKKTTSIVEFYYIWKKSAHYDLYKSNKVVLTSNGETNTEAKGE